MILIFYHRRPLYCLIYRDFFTGSLDEISLAIDSLNLWGDKTASEQGLNLELLNAEKEKLK